MAIPTWMIIENSIMSRLRGAIEWTFDQLANLFKFNDDKNA